MATYSSRADPSVAADIFSESDLAAARVDSGHPGPSTGLVSMFEYGARLVGALVAAAGGLVLVGWLLDIAVLKSVVPGLVTMKANVALGFVLSGAALWALQSDAAGRGAFYTTVACALAVSAIGFATLGEYLFAWDLGIDQLLFAEPATSVETYRPGRMSPASALLLSLLGPALLCMSLSRARFVGVAQALALLVLLASIASLIAYVHGARSLYRVAAYTSIAIHTALLFAILAAGLLCARPARGWTPLLVSPGPGGVAIRQLWLPSAAALLILSWLTDWGDGAGLYSSEFSSAALIFLCIAVLSVFTWKTALSLDRADARRSLAEAEKRQLYAGLEQRVAQRTAQLAAANHELTALNKELEAFSYSVSHDLRAPLRSMDGFAAVLIEDYAQTLDAEGKDALERIRAASQRMGQLIDELLRLSHVGRTALKLERVDLSALARGIAEALQRAQPERRVRWEIDPDLGLEADPPLVRVLMQNLLENAWKFTGKTEQAVIRVGALARDRRRAFFVADNGAGFDMAHASKMFGAFQRLHHTEDFPGTGIGLAIVQRIVHRHGGQIWAEAKPDAGATFFFVLGDPESNSHG